MQNIGKHIKFIKYNLIKPTTAGQIKFKENNKIKLPNKCKAQNIISDLIFTSRKKKLKEEQETVLIHDMIFMNKKKNRKHITREESMKL